MQDLIDKIDCYNKGIISGRCRGQGGIWGKKIFELIFIGKKLSSLRWLVLKTQDWAYECELWRTCVPKNYYFYDLEIEDLQVSNYSLTSNFGAQNSSGDRPNQSRRCTLIQLRYFEFQSAATSLQQLPRFLTEFCISIPLDRHP